MRIILLVEEGSRIPHAPLAQSTADMDWSRLEWRIYGNALESCPGQVSIPVNGTPETVQMELDTVSMKFTSVNKGILRKAG